MYHVLAQTCPQESWGAPPSPALAQEGKQSLQPSVWGGQRAPGPRLDQEEMPSPVGTGGRGWEMVMVARRQAHHHQQFHGSCCPSCLSTHFEPGSPRCLTGSYHSHHPLPGEYSHLHFVDEEMEVPERLRNLLGPHST